jgi:hypothetical protein
LALSVGSVAVMMAHRRRFATLHESEVEREDVQKLIESGDVSALGCCAAGPGYLKGLVKAATSDDLRAPDAVEHARRSDLIARRSELERGLPILATHRCSGNGAAGDGTRRARPRSHRSGAGIHTAISFSANGRQWRQGGAGEDR